MKKTLLLGVLAVGMMFTSCGMGGASLKTDKDSVSYAIGSSIGQMAFGFDSTLNVDVLVSAVRDVYAKNSKMTVEQANAQIQLYMQTKSVEDQKVAMVKFREDSTKNSAASAKYLSEKEAAGFQKTETGLLYKVDNAGAEPKAQKGDTISVNYTLTLVNGDKVDSSIDRGEPLKFPVIDGAMISGFVEGMTLFGKGGKGTIVLPADLGYGNSDNGRIGPAQALTFEIEVVDVIKAKK